MSGRFIIQKQGNEFVAKQLLLTKDKIKIYTGSSFGTTFLDYIEIIDENGVYYRFGNSLTPYGTSSTEASGANVTGWMLANIVSADKKDTVSFKWQNIRNGAGQYFTQTSPLHTVRLTDNFWATSSILPDGENAAVLGFNQGYAYNIDHDSTYSENYMNVIAGVKYKEQEIRINYTQDVITLLTDVEVYNGNNKLRQIDFQRTYFPSTASPQTNRYKLDAVVFKDKTGQFINKYSFGYNLSELPSERTLALDFWGYYNGDVNAQSLIPNFPFTINYPYSGSLTLPLSGSASRASSEAHAQANILTSVTYPTGGKTTYEYEGNKIATYGGHYVSAGGLRVQARKALF